MTNAPTLFDFNSVTIRVIEIDGEPWFVAKDVCAVLGITKPENAYRRLSGDERNTTRLTGVIRRGNPNTVIISESGLYKLVMRSDKPEALQFQD